MVGAYQDIMGDLHNLFGRVTEAHIFLDPDEESGWYIEEVIEGSTIGEVLAMTQWDKVQLMQLLKAQIDAAIRSEEHTSELQSHSDLVCRLLLEKKKK